MCGIIGVTGAGDALALLLEGLNGLEYRGYDSAGVALVTPTGLWRRRAAQGTHSVRDLCAPDGEVPAPCGTGIAHTRWATHGEPSERNAHPHLDCTGSLAIVHNGIIENHAALAVEMDAAGHVRTSDTDSEVLAHMIEAQGAVPLAEAVRRVLRRVRGTFAVAAVRLDRPELVVAARRVSPLILGLADGVTSMASDIPALLGSTRTLFALEDYQVAELEPGTIRVTTMSGIPTEPTPLAVGWEAAAFRRGGHRDFMTKEIHEQPEAVAATLRNRRAPDGRLTFDHPAQMPSADLASIQRVVIVACGSSYHSGLAARFAIEQWARVPTEVEVASEFRYRQPIVDERTLVVGVSQSGETIDTLQGLREARSRRAATLVVSNVEGSSMAREADRVLYTRAGPEVGVAATKTHLTQIVALQLLALVLAQANGAMAPDQVDAAMAGLLDLPAALETTLLRTKEVAEVAEALVDARHFFYLGRHVGHSVAMEGALKLKEISYLRAEGFPGGELKHGPIALIQPGSVVVGVATRTFSWEKICSNIEEVKCRGATVVLVGNDGDTQTAELADHVLWVPVVAPLLSPVVDAVPLQMLAYWLARAHGHDVDRPRNLAKTVTVE